MFHNFYYVTTLRGKFYLLTKYDLNNVKMQIVINRLRSHSILQMIPSKKDGKIKWVPTLTKALTI